MLLYMQQISIKTKGECEGQEFRNAVKSVEWFTKPTFLRFLSSTKLGSIIRKPWSALGIVKQSPCRSQWPRGLTHWSHCIRFWPISYIGVQGGPIGRPRSVERVVILHTLSIPRWRQFLMGLSSECIKMDEQSLLLEKRFVENITIRGREKRLDEPSFWWKRQVWRISYFVPNVAGASIKISWVLY